MANQNLNESMNKAAKWSANMMIDRKSGIPVDSNSVKTSLDALKTYATNSDDVSYPGEIISVVSTEISNATPNNSEFGAYIIDGEGNPHKLGFDDNSGNIEKGKNERAVQQIADPGKVAINTDLGEETPHFTFVGFDGESVRVEYGATGTSSATFNSRSSASGPNSFAINNRTVASGDESFSQGYQSEARGAGSVATGSQTLAEGTGAHTEGIKTHTINDGAHAEGIETISEGVASHAEGYKAVAKNLYSHAEGYNTEASGVSSHAEGSDTKATKDYAHAEGSGTKAVKDYSHAEGANTEASGTASHAEGSSTKATKDYAHAEGASTEASGTASHAEGSNTKATKDYSHTEGVNIEANGIASHAEGDIESSDTTTYNYSFSVGGKNYSGKNGAYGNYSHREGRNTLTIGDGSHAEGVGSVSKGIASHAEGSNVESSGVSSHAEGANTEAGGVSSHAEGSGTKAAKDCAHAEGSNTVANGISSHAEGDIESLDTDTYNYSFNINGSSYNGKKGAYGNYSHREGRNTLTIGDGSHAEGVGSVSKGIGSHAEGYKTEAKGDNSHTEGSKSIAGNIFVVRNITNENSFPEGSSYDFDEVQNMPSIITIYEIDTSTNNIIPESRTVPRIFSNNHFFITKEDYLYNDFNNGSTILIIEGIKTLPDNFNINDNGNSAHAEGYNTVAMGNYSHAEGYNTMAIGQASHAAGLDTIAIGDTQTVVGRYNEENSNALFIVGSGSSITNKKNNLIVSPDSSIISTNNISYDNNSFYLQDKYGTGSIKITPSNINTAIKNADFNEINESTIFTSSEASIKLLNEKDNVYYLYKNNITPDRGSTDMFDWSLYEDVDDIKNGLIISFKRKDILPSASIGRNDIDGEITKSWNDSIIRNISTDYIFSPEKLIVNGDKESELLRVNGNAYINGKLDVYNKLTVLDDLSVLLNLDVGGTITGNTSAGITELYEWADGNPNNEDRRGYFVTLKRNKLYIATPDDSYILGAIDPNPSIIMDIGEKEWKNKYLRDVFGSYIYEDVEIPAEYDDKGNLISEAKIEKQKVLNPEFKPELEYIPRTQRPEFAAITSKGRVVLRDDGTCKEDGFATVGKGGIATHSDSNIAVRVLERVDDSHVWVYIDSVFINKK